MIFEIYKKALSVISRKPLKLWGLSLLCGVFTAAASVLFGIIPGVSLALKILLSVGTTMVFLHGYLGEGVHTVQLFDCFKDWATIKRVLCGTLYTDLWIFLWALIPIVGPIFAIIRAFEYALVPYILVREPDVKITEAYKVSKERMKGYKSSLFWARVLWYVIAYAAIMIVFLLGRIPAIGILFTIIAVVAVIALLLFGKLFSGLVDAAYYVEIENDRKNGTHFGKKPAPQYYYPPQGQYYPPQGQGYYAPQGQGYYPPQGQPYYAPQAPAYAPEAAPAEPAPAETPVEAAPVAEAAPEASVEEAAPAAKFCANCGTANLPTARFCVSCGSPLK